MSEYPHEVVNFRGFLSFAVEPGRGPSQLSRRSVTQNVERIPRVFQQELKLCVIDSGRTKGEPHVNQVNRIRECPHKAHLKRPTPIGSDMFQRARVAAFAAPEIGAYIHQKLAIGVKTEATHDEILRRPLKGFTQMMSLKKSQVDAA